MKRILPATITAVAIGFAALVPMTGAQASDSSKVDVEENEAVLPATRWVDEDGYVRLPPHELERLAAVQSSAEVEEIMNSGEPVNTLLDPETFDVTAAAIAERIPESTLTPLAISFGCGASGHATSLRDVGGRGIATCYEGTGGASINIPNTYYLSAGDRATTWSYYGGGASLTVNVNNSGTLSGQSHFGYVRR